MTTGRLCVTIIAAVCASMAWGETGPDGWPVGAGGNENGTTFRCSVFSNFAFRGTLRHGQPDSRVEQMIDDIVKASGLRRNFDVVSSPDVPNAAAWVEGDRRMIGYNPNFLNHIVRRTNTEWAVKSIMAHEVGHHLQGHTLQRGGSRPSIELEADNYSGHIVRWLNGTLEHAQVAMRALAPTQGTGTHPGREDRLSSIREGWYAAGRRSDVGTSPGIPSPSPPVVPTPRPAAACCNVVQGQLIPICFMTLAALPTGAPCACYNVVGQPYFAGVACG